MQAVILAAGKCTRFWPLNEKHKSLFRIMGRPLISFCLENLKRAGLKEVIIVQGKKRDIENELKKEKISGLKIRYVIQEKPLGTGHALKTAYSYLKEKILVLNGDDYYGAQEFKKVLSFFPSILVKEEKDPTSFGVIVPQKNYVKEIAEKSKKPPSNLVNAGCYFIPKSILKEKIKKSSRREYEITDYLRKLAKKEKLAFFKAKEWFPLSYCWNLFDIKEILIKSLKREIKGIVESNCQIKGRVFVEQGTIIKSSSHIEGPVYIGKNCQIGPNCCIKPGSVIGDNCRVGQAVEIKNTILGANNKVSHLSYLGDSIVEEGANLGAGTIIANLRFDKEKIKTVVNGKIVETKRKKFGSVFGKGVQTGINVSIMPGVLIGREAVIGPHTLVKENIKEGTAFYSHFAGFKKEKKRI